MLAAPAPGVSHFAPAPTCTTPGMVRGIIAEISPESPEFLATLRKFVGNSMISRPVKLEVTDGVSVSMADGDASVTITSELVVASSKRRSCRTVRYALSGNGRVSIDRKPLASAVSRDVAGGRAGKE